MRVGRRLAAGLTPAQAARAAGLAEAEVTALLAEPGFAELVAAYRDLLDLPEEEQRRRLTRLARCVLEDAVDGRDLKVAFWILQEERHGRDPARTLAEGVIAAQRRAVRAASPAPPSRAEAPPRRRPAADPGHRMAGRVAARLRGALVREHLIRHPAAAEEARVAAKVPPAAPSVAAGLAARLLGGTAFRLCPLPSQDGEPRSTRGP